MISEGIKSKYGLFCNFLLQLFLLQLFLDATFFCNFFCDFFYRRNCQFFQFFIPGNNPTLYLYLYYQENHKNVLLLSVNSKFCMFLYIKAGDHRQACLFCDFFLQLFSTFFICFISNLVIIFCASVLYRCHWQFYFSIK